MGPPRPLIHAPEPSCTAERLPEGRTASSEVRAVEERVLRFVRDDTTLEEILGSRFGLGLRHVGRLFPCLLHPPDRHPSASLFRHPGDGSVWYHCFHTGESWTLAELYRTLLSGAWDPITHAPTHAAWWARLLVEAHVLDLPTLSLPPAPDLASLTAAEARVLHGFGFLLACKLALYPEEDLVSAYAPRFAAEWTGLPRSTARWALSRLRALGLLVQVGVLRTRHGRSIRLYAPGWRASAREGTSSL